MFTVLLVLYLLTAIAIIGLVLIQQGKGADMGASFGAGASNTVFGSGGSGNFLTRMTTILALVFLVISLVLGNLSTHKTESQWENPEAHQEQIQKKVEASTVPVKESNSNDIPE
ncbi:preprotein translocase subunit SecG [Vibrio sp.]|uniref:Protein-export membrane protein SecG n=1 Tax=Vibrio viridaestus TaxID=2487322 RepID=A0A3N9THV1_9VIBR|nr:preprotein translocase subunit SecG [Vibrio viridaestus]MDC0612083.1 preprotein translocase subunit SecG [Vibrio sp.]RQW63857.1 preprotein translocase subunit SecG [Vibrio viridaestus]